MNTRDNKMIRIGWYIIHKHSHDLPQKKKKKTWTLSLDHKLTSMTHSDKTIPASAMATGCESHRMAVC